MKSIRRRQPRGLALLLVLVALATASLVGFAMLSVSSLEAQVDASNAKIATAEGAADSAVQFAIYCLKTAQTPSGWGTTAGYTLYTSNQSLPGVSHSGKFDLSVVAQPANETYTIHAVGKSSGATPITRTIDTTVQIVRVTPKFAAIFGGTGVIPSAYTITGNVLANGSCTAALGATVSGTIRQTTNADDFVVPSSWTGINKYGAGTGGTYKLADGTVGTPQTITSPLSSAPTAAANNPGAVFYCASNLDITSAITIQGTLIVNGVLTIKPSVAGTVTVTPKLNFPAILTSSSLKMNSTSNKLIANGVCWLGGGTAWLGANNLNSKITINGALLIPASQSLNVGVNAAVAINYVDTNCNVLNMTTAVQPIASVRFVDWTQ